MSFWTEETFEEVDKQQASFDVVPAGDYNMILINSGVKATKAGTGNYLNCTFEITAPSSIGRKLFQTFNVNNPNPKAVSIGLGQLKDFLTAVGKIAFYETLKTVTSWEEAASQLSGLFEVAGNVPVVGVVSIKRDETYGDKNEIKRFHADSAVTVVPVAKPVAGKKPF